MHWFRWQAALAAIAIIVAAPTTARSSDAPSTAEINAARDQFAEGRKLEEAGRFGDALVLFQDVARVKMTPQVRFHIALCLMHTGKHAEALANFRVAKQEAGTSAPNVVAESKAHIATLEKQVARLTVVMPANDSSFTITLDERPIAANVTVDANPGRYEVVLRHDGQAVDKRLVTLQVGESVRVEFSQLPVQPNGWRTASIVAFSVAGAGVIGASVFTFLRAERLATLEAACPSFTGCSRSLEPVVRDGKTFSATVNVFAGVAGAAAATGVVLYVMSRSSSSDRTSSFVDVGVIPAVGLGGGFVALHGRF
ncbi:MAG: tetratricopeptide repeat protein [Polyangiaceae bacterium]|nr:tetratricopeptide repeat protein [Polyangiaceae bacterium]